MRHRAGLPRGRTAALPILVALVALAACRVRGEAARASAPAPSGLPPNDDAGEVELVESVPLETTLDQPDLRDTWVVWLEMIRRARKRLDFAEFYASSASGTRLDQVIGAIEEAADRGVAVRFLAEASFASRYPETLERLARRRGVEVRRVDFSKSLGGILHAKYFLVDGVEAYLGSANFDWRALTHIHEIGVRTSVPAVVAALEATFQMDWALAGGADPAAARRAHAPRAVPDDPLDDGPAPVRVRPLLSPRGWLPDERAWDLPALVAMIDGARRTVRVQLLTYKVKDRQDGDFHDLDRALRRAAARGVRVELAVADWSKRAGTIEGLQELVGTGVRIRLVTVPQFSGGYVPFSRVVHAKYLVVDGWRAWVGTSNWEGDYFHRSRNVGVIIEGGQVPWQLERVFATVWESGYAADVDPAARYVPPRFGD